MQADLCPIHMLAVFFFTGQSNEWDKVFFLFFYTSSVSIFPMSCEKKKTYDQTRNENRVFR